jgi:beta-lactamase regulating signal transducer with metallopeptidase domain
MNMPSINTLTSAFDFALHASLLSATGIVLVLMIRWILRGRVAPAARGWLWLPVALLCLSPRLPSVIGWNVSPDVLPTPVREVLAPVNAPVVVRGEPQLLLNRPEPTSPAATAGLSVREKMAIAWGAGSVGIFGFWLVAYAGLWRRVHREKGEVSARLATEFKDCVASSGLRSAPGLIVTGAVDNPAVAGLWHPVVLMPPGLADSMEDEPLRHVLLHELGHIRRWDLWLHWLSALVVALHWFNPLMWLASRKFRADREAACDATVIGVSGNKAHAYGETLLALGSRVPRVFSPRLMAGILGSADLVRQRIVDIARMGRTSRLAAWFAFLVVMSGAAAIALAAAEPGAPAATIPPSKVATPGATSDLYTRTFKVPPDFIQWAQEQNQQPPVDNNVKDLKNRLTAAETLKNLGVPFPEGASAVFVPSTSQLIVRNTTANLEIVEAIVEVKLNNPVRQVYVTCHLVVFKEGSKPEMLGVFLAAPEKSDAVIVPAADGAATPVVVQHPALPPSAPFAISGVFTDPQFQVIMRMLSGKQKALESGAPDSGLDVPFKNIASQVEAVVRMPSVTTRSGQRATLEVVREFIYPTEYEKEKPAKEGDKAGYAPVAFEAKPLGFRLEMEPVIGPDGYTIDLNLTPQLPGFTGWVEPVLADGAKIKQPTFGSNTVTTSVSIWDGQTVAFGGEAFVAPFLMDPSLKSEAAVLAKRHPVMIFVTAKMIDPSGRSVNESLPKTSDGTTGSTGPQTTVVPFRLGPKKFAGPDLIELLEVKSTSANLEKGDTVTVKGRCRLGSRDEAALRLSVTSARGERVFEEEEAIPSATMKRGIHPFELTFTVPQQGQMKVSLYPVEGGNAIGEVYFGTQAQMDEAAKLGLGK